MFSRTAKGRGFPRRILMILMHLIQHVAGLTPVLPHPPQNPAQGTPQYNILTPTPAVTPNGAPNGVSEDAYAQIQGFVLNITNFLQILSFSIFLLSVTVAGIMYMLSMNNDRHKATATGAIVTAVVGLIITLLATGLHGIIQSAFPGQ